MKLTRAPKILYLFGLTGAGKNRVGEVLRDRFGYAWYDADLDLTPAMRAAIEKKQLFSEKMRDEFFKIVAVKMQAIRAARPQLVVGQATYCERHRTRLRQQFPEAALIWVRAPEELIMQRLIKRGDQVTPAYAAQIARNFEEPAPGGLTIDNDAGEERIVAQLFELFG